MATKTKKKSVPLFVYPEKTPLFTVTELPNNWIQVTYQHSGELDRDSGEWTGFKHIGEGPDLGKALDQLVEKTSRALGRTFDMGHRKGFNEFLEELKAKGRLS